MVYCFFDRGKYFTGGGCVYKTFAKLFEVLKMLTILNASCGPKSLTIVLYSVVDGIKVIFDQLV